MVELLLEMGDYPIRRGIMEKMQGMTLRTFVDDLASNSPAPGGGSAAALSASLGAALSSMVLNLTVGKKFYNEYDEETKGKIGLALEGALALKDEFLTLMDKDVEAFNELMAAFKLPKDSEEEKALRNTKIQEGYVLAMEVPLAMAKKTMGIFDVLEVSAKYGNPNAISDAGVGALLALTGLESAILNVRINLSGIKDKDMVDGISRECRELLDLGKEKKQFIMDIVESKL
jgi:methenyltetrahydrofolate cyclohydrolase